ncbi:MAG: DUF1186 domain-containing protein [bacterium]
MSRGGNQIRGQKLGVLIEQLENLDDWGDIRKVEEIASYGPKVVPYLEDILLTALEKSSKISLTNPPKDSDRFIVIHALYLLAHLQPEDSLDLVLQFLSQKQEILNCWLPDLLTEDIWEVVYFLGQNTIEKLEGFVLNQDNNMFSRLAVCTALIQMSANHESKKRAVARIVKKVLELEKEDPDFIGLLVSELLDIKDMTLQASILEALKRHDVWPGIISAEEVQLLYNKKEIRARAPLGIHKRYEYFRQCAHSVQTSPFNPQKRKKRRKVEKHI